MYYDIDTSKPEGGIPYIQGEIYLSDKNSLQTYMLWDSCASHSLISLEFFKSLPESIKETIESIENAEIKSALKSSKVNIFGKVKLLITLKDDENDKFPLKFSHFFLVIPELKHKIYIGADLIGNTHFKALETNSEITIRFPKDYELAIDPYNFDKLKTIQIRYFSQTNITPIIVTNTVTLNPYEIKYLDAHTNDTAMKTKTVFIKPDIEVHDSMLDEEAEQTLPYVLNSIETFNNEGKVAVLVQNLQSLPIHIKQGCVIARAYNYSIEDEISIENIEAHNVDLLFREKINYDRKQMSECEYSVNNIMTSLDDEEHELPLQFNTKKMTKNDFSEEEFLAMFNLKHLSHEQKEEITEILKAHREAFGHFPLDIGKVKNYEHSFELIEEPKQPKQRMIPHKHKDKVNQLIENYVLHDIMAEGPAKFYSNLVPVYKEENDKLRLCVDMVPINSKISMVGKVVQITSPEEIFHKLHGKKFVAKLDVLNGYFNIPASEEVQKYYGIFGTKQMFLTYFTRMIQGCKSAPYDWSEYMASIFNHLSNNVIWYLDDVLIFADTYEEFIYIFKQILKIAIENNFPFAPKKLELLKTTIVFLGIEISITQNCKAMTEQKIQAITAIPRPTSYKQLLAFLSKLNYYRTYILNLGYLALPLRLKMRDKCKLKFKWDETLDKSFKLTKKAVAASISNFIPSKNSTYKMYVDASYFVMSGTLEATDENGIYRTVCVSCKLFPENYLSRSIFHKELTALKTHLKIFSSYIMYKKIIVFTDAKSLLFCNRVRDISSPIYRLAMFLSTFDFELYHCKSADNPSDYFTRIFKPFEPKTFGEKEKQTVKDIEKEIHEISVKPHYTFNEVHALLTASNDDIKISSQTLLTNLNKSENEMNELYKTKVDPIILNFCHEVNNIQVNNIQIQGSNSPVLQMIRAGTFESGTMSIPTFKQAQQDDPEILAICKRLKAETPNTKHKLSKYYYIKEGVLLRIYKDEEDKDPEQEIIRLPRIVVPKSLVNYIIEMYHSTIYGAHNQTQTMYNNIKRKYYFPNMQELVEAKCKSCRFCSYTKTDTSPPSTVGKARQGYAPLKTVMCDLAVNLPVSKNGMKHVLIVIDCFTRFTAMIPIKNRSSLELLCAFLTGWVSTKNLPTFFVSDNEKGLVSGIFEDYFKNLGVQFKSSIPYSPTAQGQVEGRVNRCKKLLTTLLMQVGNTTEWDLYLPHIAMSVNSSYNAAIGATPNLCLYGFENDSPCLDLLRLEAVVSQDDDVDAIDTLMRIDRKVLDKHILQCENRQFLRNNAQQNKRSKPREFQIGDKVMRKRHRHMLAPQVSGALVGKYTGPLEIVKVQNNQLILKDIKSGTELREHIGHVKLYNEDENDHRLPESWDKEIVKLTKPIKHPMKTRSKSK